VNSNEKSPGLSALFSFIVPGLGHLYCGAWGRGLGAGALFCVLFFSLGGIADFFYPLCYLTLVPAVAYDAWKASGRENLAERAELAAGPVPLSWLHWLWGAIRAVWIVAFALAFGAAAVSGAMQALRHGAYGGALTITLFGLGLLVLSWFAGRSTWRVLTGAEPITKRALVDELCGTALLLAFAGLMIAIAAPAFTGLFRKSAEGAMKNRLGELRAAFVRYRADNSENPPSLEALVDAKLLPQIPELWPSHTKIPHDRVRATILLPDGKPTDSGKWAYAVGTSTPVFIDCTHTDWRGNAWNSF